MYGRQTPSSASISHDPGVSPGSASQCILGKVYLRCSLSMKALQELDSQL